MKDVRENYLDSLKVPKIYCYTTPEYKEKGYIKVGYTTQDVEKRIKEQFPILMPDEHDYEILYSISLLKKMVMHLVIKEKVEFMKVC